VRDHLALAQSLEGGEGERETGDDTEGEGEGERRKKYMSVQSKNSREEKDSVRDNPDSHFSVSIPPHQVSPEVVCVRCFLPPCRADTGVGLDFPVYAAINGQHPLSATHPDPTPRESLAAAESVDGRGESTRESEKGRVHSSVCRLGRSKALSVITCPGSVRSLEAQDSSPAPDGWEPAILVLGAHATESVRVVHALRCTGLAFPGLDPWNTTAVRSTLSYFSGPHGQRSVQSGRERGTDTAEGVVGFNTRTLQVFSGGTNPLRLPIGLAGEARRFLDEAMAPSETPPMAAVPSDITRNPVTLPGCHLAVPAYTQGVWRNQLFLLRVSPLWPVVVIGYAGDRERERGSEAEVEQRAREFAWMLKATV
ncbi:hypothetical protein KIPB_009090, partial [Kipferlia bialata]